jgi:ubiquitin-protein ligase
MCEYEYFYETLIRNPRAGTSSESLVFNVKYSARSRYTDGGICLDVMKTLWKPVYTVGMILQSIQSLLSDPNPNSAANPEAAQMLMADPKAYKRKVRRCAEMSVEATFD